MLLGVINMIDIITPVGRLVRGHPLMQHKQVDNAGQPKLFSDGQQMMQTYVALAIPKQGEQHWAQTEWGAQIYQMAVESWPAGEYQQAAFAWKITDGDSQIPDKKMKKPFEREGFAGHWVINASTLFNIACYHRDSYDPSQRIQVKETIKTGDYCRMQIEVKSNESTQTAGIYVTPKLFELYQCGVKIIGDSEADPGAFVAAGAGVLPVGALIDTVAPAPVAPAPVAPAPVAPAPVAPAPGVAVVPAPVAPVPVAPVPVAPVPGVAVVPAPVAPVPGVAVVPDMTFVNPQ